MTVELSAKVTSSTVKDYSSNGTRIDVNFQGEVTGKYNGTHTETVSFLFKPDGTNEAESRPIEFTNEGDLVYLTAKARGEQVNPSMVKIESDVEFQTPSEKLSWLNSIKGRGEGIFDPARGELSLKIYTK